MTPPEFLVEHVKAENEFGNEYWIVFRYGQFSQPLCVISNDEMVGIAEQVIRENALNKENNGHQATS